MCVISIIDKGKMPKLKTLENMEKLNSHGAGIAYVKDDKVYYQKGLSAKQIHKILSTGVKHPIVHFRIATVGDKSKELCHPFPINDDATINEHGICDKVLFHNGHWDEWQDICLTVCIKNNIKFPDGQMSDSRAMAWLVNIFGDGFLNLVKGDNKMAILSKDGIKKYGDDWSKVDNTLCSNDYFESMGLYNTSASFDNNFDDFYNKSPIRVTTYGKYSQIESELLERVKGKTPDEIQQMWIDGLLDEQELNYVESIIENDDKPEWEKQFDDYAPINMASAKELSAGELMQKSDYKYYELLGRAKREDDDV